MYIDFVLAVIAGVATWSFSVFFAVLFFALLINNPKRPWSSGLVSVLLIMLGISFLFGGDDGDIGL